MDREAVEEEYIAGIHLATDPLAACDSFARNFRYMKVLVIVVLKAEVMRSFYDL